MNLYNMLLSKKHNPHYLKRYYKFIEHCKNKSNIAGEQHHILPKSKDLFPEYASFKEYPWNKILLSLREHYIAHLLLWKSYAGNQGSAFHLMSIRLKVNNSRLYEKAKIDCIRMLKENNKNRIYDKSHNFIIANPAKNSVSHRTGTHHTVESKNKISSTLKKFYHKNIHGRSIKIIIYNNLDIPVYTCLGNFNETCKLHNLPIFALRDSYLQHGKRIYLDNPPKIIERMKFKGWYAQCLPI